MVFLTFKYRLTLFCNKGTAVPLLADKGTAAICYHLVETRQANKGYYTINGSLNKYRWMLLVRFKLSLSQLDMTVDEE